MFATQSGAVVPAVTADQMREVDRIAVDEFGLGLLQMMENAGRNLAENALNMMEGATSEVTILAGSGGNGGGGLCCARHLHNRGVHVHIVLDRAEAELHGAASNQLNILREAGVHPVDPATAPEFLRSCRLVVDALIGYGLRGAPGGRAAELIALCNQQAGRVLSLDVPSGIDATTGQAHGPVVRADRILTLALPKTGLADTKGDLFLADIGIPPAVFRRIGLSCESPFGNRYWIRLERRAFPETR